MLEDLIADAARLVTTGAQFLEVAVQAYVREPNEHTQQLVDDALTRINQSWLHAQVFVSAWQKELS